jgi:hypothetical protein
MNISEEDLDLLYKLWVKASAEECLAITPGNYYIERDNKFEFKNIWDSYFYKFKLYYDPNHKFFTEFLEGIDNYPKKLSFMYRPCASFKTYTPGWKLYHTYKTKIVNKYVLKLNESYIKIKEDNMIKRYYNCFLNKIKVFYFEEKPDVKIYNGNNVKISFVKIKDFTEINSILYKHLEYYEFNDIFVFCFGNEKSPEIIIDNFIPAQPLWLNSSTIILTPIILQQINGFNDFQDLYSRVNKFIGSIIITDEDIEFPLYDKNCKVISGISDYETGIFKDGRVKRVNPDFVRHIPRMSHGWSSLPDIFYILTSVINYKNPKVVLELGSWYGQSARIICNNNKNKNFTLYSVDKFSSGAGNTRGEIPRLLESYKMIFNHFRYETFAANLSYEKNTPEDKIPRYFSDLPDQNPDKQVVMMKMTFMDSLDVLKLNNITPQVVYIHHTFLSIEEMIQLIEKINNYFPECIIVATNHNYKFNREALDFFNFKYLKVYENSYYITRNGIDLKNISDGVEKYIELINLPNESENYYKNVKYFSAETILKEPFMDIRTLSKFLISEYFKKVKEIKIYDIITILKKIIKNPEIFDGRLIMAPNTYTPFDHFLEKIEFE